MKIGMYLVGESAEYAAMGVLASQVAKHVMPGIEVWHFTDEYTRLITGCNVSRMERHAPLAVFRMQHHQVPGEWLFIDVDVLVTQDVQHVFDNPFDIAIAERVDGDGAKGFPYYREMPHNMGVVFSRSPAFWKAAETELRTYDPKMQQWMGDQFSVCRLIKSGDFNTKILPGGYNYPPRTPEIGNASIVHCKGKRKLFMAQLAAEILSLEVAA